MLDDSVENGFGLEPFLDNVDEIVEPPEAVEFQTTVELRGIERTAKNADGFVVRFQRHRERVAVLATGA